MHKIVQYLRHQWRAKTKHGVHSPFVYDFVTQVLPHRPTEMGSRIEKMRKRSLASKQILEIEDFGAGYGGQARPVISKTMRQVVRSSARRRREGELLGRLVRHYAPRQLLELGTNLGFSTMYLAGNSGIGSQLISIEGSKQLSKVAALNLAELGLVADLRIGEFSAVLQTEIDWASFKPNFVLLDGNHREQATLDYFEFLLPRLGAEAMIVLDDIYWSEGMTKAWNAIVAAPRVTVSIDLYGLGICFMDRPQAKEHFRIKTWAL
jgi:predicted O-methyltransferase YrrM